MRWQRLLRVQALQSWCRAALSLDRVALRFKHFSLCENQSNIDKNRQMDQSYSICAIVRPSVAFEKSAACKIASFFCISTKI